MARRLRTWVHVDGQAYGPEDDVPADVAKKIENPDVWAEDEPSGDDSAPKRSGGNSKK